MVATTDGGNGYAYYGRRAMAWSVRTTVMTYQYVHADHVFIIHALSELFINFLLHFNYQLSTAQKLQIKLEAERKACNLLWHQGLKTGKGYFN